MQDPNSHDRQLKADSDNSSDYGIPVQKGSARDFDDFQDYAGDHFGAAFAAGSGGKNGIFIDAASMKEKLRENMCKPVYDVANYYHNVGLFRYVATHKIFEFSTLGVIALNALWISIDTDHNDATVLLGAQPIFQIVEQFFCAYFTFEWFVRYCAFRRKRNGCKDAWFVFDSCMVFMMVAETWVMTIVMLATGAGGSGGMGNASILRLARLLRLSRMMRMARLLRAMPELMILIKGMVAAMRSVLFTLALLAIMTYVFGIMFTQLMVDTEVGELNFSTVPLSMHTLVLDGTFLDNLGTLVKALGDEGLVYAILFYMFVLLSALTVMNMLIGVLCEVVSAVAATEKEELTVAFVREKLQEVMTTSGLDEDGDGEISKVEFCKILEIPAACRTMEEVGVDVFALIDIADFLFDEGQEEGDEPKQLSFQEFMEVVLQLRGSNGATVKDVVDLRKFISTTCNRLEGKLEKTMDNNIRKSTMVLRNSLSERPAPLLPPHLLSPHSSEPTSPHDETSWDGSSRRHTVGDSRASCSTLRPLARQDSGAQDNPEQTRPDHRHLLVTDDREPHYHGQRRRSRSPPHHPDHPESAHYRASPDSPSRAEFAQNDDQAQSPKSQKLPLNTLLQLGEAELDKLIAGIAEDLDRDMDRKDNRDTIPGMPDDIITELTPMTKVFHNSGPRAGSTPKAQKQSGRSPQETEDMHRQLLRLIKLKKAIGDGMPAVRSGLQHLGVAMHP